MRKPLYLFVIVVLIVSIAPVTAQDDLTQVYDDGGLSFRYPDGWVLEEENGVSIQNFEAVEDSESDVTTQLQPGQITIAFVSNNLMAEDDIKLPAVDDPTFVIGFYTGVITFVLEFASAFNEDLAGIQIVYDNIETASINGQDAARVQLSIGETNAALIAIMYEEPLLIFVGSGDDLSTWEDTVEAVLNSTTYALSE